MKLTVKDTGKPIFPKLRGLIDLMRPMSLLGSFIAGFFLVMLCSNYYQIKFNPWLGTTIGIIFTLLQSGGQVFNQSNEEEIKIDRINKPYRPIPQGIITVKEGKIFASILFLTGNLIAFAVKPEFCFFTVIITLFAITYTSGLRIKRIFLINNMHQSIARGFLPVISVFSLFGPLNLFSISLGILISSWIMSFQSTKDFGDIPGDKIGGVNTLPVVLGKKNSIYIMSLLMLISFLLLFLFLVEGIFPESFLWLFILIIPSLLIIYGLIREFRHNLIENNVSWLLFYLCLCMWYILPAIL